MYRQADERISTDSQTERKSTEKQTERKSAERQTERKFIDMETERKAKDRQIERKATERKSKRAGWHRLGRYCRQAYGLAGQSAFGKQHITNRLTGKEASKESGRRKIESSQTFKGSLTRDFFFRFFLIIKFPPDS
jgi:hypothetical protein